MTTVRANSSVTEVVSVLAQLRLMNFPTFPYRFACLLLLAILAHQAPLIGQETLQPQRIINLDKFLGRGAATGVRPPLPTAKLDLGYSKFKQALASPAFASNPQVSFESGGTPRTTSGFGAQVPNFQSTSGIQLPYSFSPNRATPQRANYQPTPLTSNYQTVPTPAVSSLAQEPEPTSLPGPSLESEQTSIPIQRLKEQSTSTHVASPQTDTQNGIEFEMLPTVPGSPIGGSQLPLPEMKTPSSLPEFAKETPLNSAQPNGQATSDFILHVPITSMRSATVSQQLKNLRSSILSRSLIPNLRRSLVTNLLHNSIPNLHHNSIPSPIHSSIPSPIRATTQLLPNWGILAAIRRPDWFRLLTGAWIHDLKPLPSHNNSSLIQTPARSLRYQA